MKRYLSLLILLPAVGCTPFKPVGILDPNGEAKRNLDPMAVAEAEGMRIPEAPPPPAPAQLVSAADIDPANPDDAVRKLAAEIESDRKAADGFPNYPKMSRVRAK